MGRSDFIHGRHYCRFRHLAYLGRGLFVALLLSATWTPALCQDTVLIGVISGTSGPSAHFGKDNKNGAEMAAVEINRSSPMIDGRRVEVKLITEDSGGDSGRSVAIAQMLCDRKVHGAVGNMSDPDHAASRVLNDCGVPFISISTNPGLTKLGYKTTFRFIANDNTVGVGLAHYAASSLKLRSVAIIADRSDAGIGLAAAFRRAVIQKGISIVGEESVNEGDTSFSQVLGNFRKKGSPEAILYAGKTEEPAGHLIHQLEATGPKGIRVFVGSETCNDHFDKFASRLSNMGGVVCGSPKIPLEKMPGGMDWKKRYDKMFNPAAFAGYSPYAYDAVRVLVDAMVRAKSTDRATYLSKLHRSNFSGVTGTIGFGAGGEPASPMVALYRYEPGTKMLLDLASVPNPCKDCKGTCASCGDGKQCCNN